MAIAGGARMAYQNGLNAQMIHSEHFRVSWVKGEELYQCVDCGTTGLTLGGAHWHEQHGHLVEEQMHE